MGKIRYGDYKKAISLLRTSETDATPPSLPAGSPLAEYQKYISGEKDISYERAADSLPEKLLVIGVKPFGLPDAETNIVPVKFSQRASNNSTLSGVKTACSHETEDKAILRLEGFDPAKAIVTHTTGTTVTTATSQVTERKYRTKGKKSYTFPFGQGDSTKFQKQARDAITTVLADSTLAAFDVTFQSEEL